MTDVPCKALVPVSKLYTGECCTLMVPVRLTYSRSFGSDKAAVLLVGPGDVEMIISGHTLVAIDEQTFERIGQTASKRWRRPKGDAE